MSSAGLIGPSPSGSRPTALEERKRAHPEDRRDTAQLGMWIFLASELLFFGGLLFAYLYGRTFWPDGFAQASRHTDVLIGTLNTAILLTSSAFAAMSVAMTGADGRQRRWIARFLWMACALGCLFLLLKGFEWHSEWREGLFPGKSFHLTAGVAPPVGAEMFFMLYFVVTGLHALHMVVGIVTFAIFAARTAAIEAAGHGHPGHRLDIPVEMAALYWHFVDIVWIFLYPLLYLVERHP